MSQLPPTPAALARWISGPSILGGLVGGLFCVGYGLITLSFVEGSGGYFSAIALGACVGCTVIGDQLEQRAMGAIRSLLPEGNGVQALQRAARAAHRFPDASFLINLTMWGFGCSFVAILYRLIAGPGASVTSWRIALLGLGLAPMISVITYLLVQERSRRAVERICSLGLTAKQAALALASQRRQLRLRLMALTAVAGATPALFIADVIWSQNERRVSELLAVPDREGQLLLAQQLGAELDLRTLALGMALASVGIATAMIAGRGLVRPLRRLAEAAGRLGTGNLDAPPLVVADDEVWSASASFSAIHEQLRDALSRLRTAGLKLNHTTGQLTGAGEAQQGGSAEQAAALNETFATTEELARSAGQIAENATEVSNIASKTLEAAQHGQHSARTFFASMMQMADENRRVADSVLKLNKRVQQIGKVVEFIHEVGDKSDLLALNAELEGTKAGEVGRGFSLVAAEMRRLAETVVQSTHEIERLIDEIRDGTNAAVMATESGLKGMDGGNALAKQVLDKLEEIVALARDTSESVRSISLSTQQQQTGSDQLTEAMAEILRITQEGSASGEQMSATNQTLCQLATSLQSTVQQFRLEREESGG